MTKRGRMMITNRHMMMVGLFMCPQDGVWQGEQNPMEA